MFFFNKIIKKIIQIFLIEYTFGFQAKKNKKYYTDLFNSAKSYKDEFIDNFIKKKNINLDNDWFDNLALHTQVVIKKSKINYYHGKILYALVSEHIALNNLEYINILETGTARGYSSLCMSKAINNMKIKGKIYTIDILPHNKKMFWNCIDDHDGKRTRAELLVHWKDYVQNIEFITGFSKNILQKIDLKRINFAFLDGAHNLRTIKKEYEYVSQRQKKNDIIFFDDITNDIFPELSDFIRVIEKNNTYKVDYLSSSESRGYALAVKL